MSLIVIAFCAGLVAGLIIGPDSEREYAARVEGWIDGYAKGRGE